MSLKQKLFYALMRSRIYPHIYFHANPFKIYEFRELTRNNRPRPTDQVLDIGCGAGLQTRILARTAGRTIGIDISKNALDRARSETPASGDERVEFRLTTIESAGFQADQFDKIYSVCVIEHIPDFRSVFRECLRILKPGGVLCFSVDSLKSIEDESFLHEHAREHKVVRYFSCRELKQELEDVGFKDVSVKPILCSAAARGLFMKHIRERSQFRYSRSILWSFLLMWADVFARKDEGIFLIARCRK